mgnify:CR=1 FL=1
MVLVRFKRAYLTSWHWWFSMGWKYGVALLASLHLHGKSLKMSKKGVIDSVKKGGLLLILGIETTHKGQVWTCLGVLGLAINMRQSFPHWWPYSTTSRVWSCGEHTLIPSALVPNMTRCYGSGMEHRSRLDSVSMPLQCQCITTWVKCEGLRFMHYTTHVAPND